MNINIVLTILLVIIIIYYIKNKYDKETFEIEYENEPINELPKSPRNIMTDLMPDSTSMEEEYSAQHETLTKNCKNSECRKIDKYRNQFFNFQTRINNNSHLNDSVDNINITNKGRDYDVGVNIADIYDDLVNTNDYKS